MTAGRNTITAALAALAIGAGALAPAPAAAVSPGAYLAAREADRDGAVTAAARLYLEALAADPQNLDLLSRATRTLVASGDVDRATSTALQLIDARPDDALGNLVIIVDALARGDAGAAYARLRERGSAFMPLARALLSGWAAAADDRLNDALAAFAELEDGDFAAVLRDYHVGLAYLLRGDAATALAALDAAADAAFAPTAQLVVARGAALQLLGRAAEARAVFETAIAESRLGDPVVEAALRRLDAGQAPQPPIDTAQHGAAEALFNLASVMGARDESRRNALWIARLATHLRPDFAAALILAGEIAERADQPADALAAYAGVGAEDPLWSRAQIGRSRALRAEGRDDAATEALRALTARLPDDVDAFVALGDQYRRTEAWDQAAAAYGRAIELRAESGAVRWTLYYQRGIAFERGQRWPLAEADFQRALELEPDQPLVLNYLGYSWVEMGVRLEEAKAMIQRAVDQRPQDGYITDSLGWVLYRLGDYAGAVEWLERAVEMEPVDPVINDHLGDALWRVGRRVEAEFQWRRARSLDPEPDVLERIKRKLSVGLDAVLQAEAAADEEIETPAAAGDDG